MKHFVGMQKGEYKTLKINYKKVFVGWLVNRHLFMSSLFVEVRQ